MSIEKFTGKIKEPKKLPKIKSKNPLENFDYHIKGEDLFPNGIDYVVKKLSDVARKFGINRLYEKNLISELDRRKRNLYSENKKPETIAKILGSKLYKDDVKNNSDKIISEKENGKVTRTKDGVPPRNYRRIMRFIFAENQIYTVCDCCDASLALPNLWPYKELGQILTTNVTEIIGALYSSIYNWIMLCPNCESMWKKIHTKKFARGGYAPIIQKRCENFHKKLTDTMPAALRAQINQKPIQLNWKGKKQENGQRTYLQFEALIKVWNRQNPVYSICSVGNPEQLKKKIGKLWEKFA